MGREISIEVQVEIRKKINKFRHLEYQVKNHDPDDETLKAILDFLHTAFIDDIFDIIDMDISESKNIEDWGVYKLRILAQKLRIPHWGRASKCELIFQIKKQEKDVKLYFPSQGFDKDVKREGQDGSSSTETATEAAKRERRRNTSRAQEIRTEISKPFKPGTSFGEV